MVSTLKENPNGGFFCSECRMSISEPVETCPFCGSIVSNWMDIVIKQENDNLRLMFDLDPITGKNKFARNELAGQRAAHAIDDYSFMNKEEIKEILEKMKVETNESDIHGRD